jgi:MFS family permease
MVHVSRVKLFLFVDLVGVALVVPLLPSIALERMSQSMFGLSSTVYGLLQIVSAPIVLRLSDRLDVDSRLLLFCSAFFTAASYFLMCLTSSATFFFVARVLAGLSRHSSSLSKTFLTGEVCCLACAFVNSFCKKQKVNLGDLQILSSLAFIGGPLIATRLPTRMACLFSVVMLVLASFVALSLPKMSNAVPQTELNAIADDARENISLPKLSLFRSGMSTFGASLFSSALYVSSIDRVASGNLRSVAAGSNVVALLLSRRYFASIAPTWLAVAMSSSMLLLLEFPFFILPLASAFGALLSRSLIAALLASRPSSQRGALVGLDDALGSVARAVAPLVAGILLDWTASPRLAYYMSSILFFAVALV